MSHPSAKPEPAALEECTRDLNRKKSRSSGRDSSLGKQSAAKKRSFQEFLSNALECPVCMEPIRPPIPQCENGHVCCTGCRQRLKDCSVCRVEYKCDIRCLQLEKMSENFEYPCQFSKNGCSHTAFLRHLTAHELTCNYRPRVRCPLPNGCAWEGVVSNFMPHMIEKHNRHSPVKPASVDVSGHALFKFALEKVCTHQSYWVSVYSAFGSLFFLLVRASTAELYATVSEIKEPESGEMPEFEYSLRAQVHDRTYGPQVFAFEGACPPLGGESGGAEAHACGRGLFVKQSLLQRCFDRDTSQTFVIHGSIRRAPSVGFR